MDSGPKNTTRPEAGRGSVASCESDPPPNARDTRSGISTGESPPGASSTWERHTVRVERAALTTRSGRASPLQRLIPLSDLAQVGAMLRLPGGPHISALHHRLKPSGRPCTGGSTPNMALP